MKKYKIAVYAISKNEEQFVDRWVNAVSEADDIYVLDTGSTDNTVKKLKEHNVHVKKKIINPWRFDNARNLSLEMVPKDVDICVCLDLDEVIQPGWRKDLESTWEKFNPTRVRYMYHWKLTKEDIPVVSFYLDKIHQRKNYYWKYPVHEVLKCKENERFANSSICVKHYPDNNKSRGSYLTLLELSVKEDPTDDRNLHYLGREYMFYKMYDKSIDTLHKHLACKKATWKDERCASMRFIARCYLGKGYIEEAEDWYKRAVKEAPYLREAYVELASLYYSKEQFNLAYITLKKALKVKEKSNSYIIDEFAWNDVFYDLFSLSCFYTGHIKDAIKYVKKAIELNPNEPRYQKNLEIMLPLLSTLHE